MATKFCKDCKYFGGDLEFGERAKCMRRVPCLVWGEKPIESPAKYQRLDRFNGEISCGPEAKFFEPK